jgi:preprotein translocase subunit SecD
VTRRTRPLLTAIVLVVGGCSRPPDSGVQLGYRILGERVALRPEIVAELKQVVRRRVEGSGVPYLEFLDEAEGLVVKLPGASDETVLLVKRLLRSQGKLEFRPAAPVDVQEIFNREGKVPPGYSVVLNSTPARGGVYEAFGAKVVLQDPVLRSRNIADAEPREERVPGGTRWVTTFELDPEGAQRFDDAAAQLYNRKPPGLLAILVDGEIRSMPAVQSPAFHGRGQISGAKNEQDARELAVILRSGELPVLLGARKDGKDVPGEPESEKRYGSPK